MKVAELLSEIVKHEKLDALLEALSKVLRRDPELKTRLEKEVGVEDLPMELYDIRLTLGKYSSVLKEVAGSAEVAWPPEGHK